MGETIRKLENLLQKDGLIGCLDGKNLRNCSIDDLRKIERNISKACHPDRNGGKEYPFYSEINGLIDSLKRSLQGSNINNSSDYECGLRTIAQNVINKFKTYDDYDLLIGQINSKIDEVIKELNKLNDIKLSEKRIVKLLTQVVNEIFYNHFKEKFDNIVDKYISCNDYELIVEKVIISKKEELFKKYQENYTDFNIFAKELEDFIKETFNNYSHITSKLKDIHDKLCNLVYDYSSNEDFNKLWQLYDDLYFSLQEYISKEMLIKIDNLDSKINTFLLNNNYEAYKKVAQRTISMIFFNPFECCDHICYLEQGNDGPVLITINSDGEVVKEKSIEYNDINEYYISLESVLKSQSDHLKNFSYIYDYSKKSYITCVFGEHDENKFNYYNGYIFYKSYESFDDKNHGFFYFSDSFSGVRIEDCIRNPYIDYTSDKDFSRLIDDIVSSTKRILDSYRAKKVNVK